MWDDGYVLVSSWTRSGGLERRIIVIGIPGRVVGREGLVGYLEQQVVSGQIVLDGFLRRGNVIVQKMNGFARWMRK